MNDARAARWALAALVPVPTLGLLCGLYWFPGQPLGMAVFAVSKVWLVLFPFLWRRWMKSQSRPMPDRRLGGVVGIGSGLIMGGVILAAYRFALADWLSPGLVREAVARMGLDRPVSFLAAGAYWVLVNSLIEEYVWRGFVVEQAGRIMRPVAAVWFGAAAFTVHHVFALASRLPWPVVLAGSAGVFIAGLTWSMLYARYGRLWPSYLSHALADLAIFGLIYRLAFAG